MSRGVYVIEDMTEFHTRARAYCVSNNLGDGDEWRNYEYMIWITGKVAEFKRSLGLSEITRIDHDAFNAWLWAQIKKPPITAT